MPLPRTFRQQRNVTLIVAALIVMLAAGTLARLGHRAFALAPAAGNTPIAWTEAAWAMPLDNWGQGRVWHATGRDGGDITLAARTKTGFCNCFNGIADDVEIDRIGDVDLHGDNFIPTAPGRPTAVGDLPGRERAFQTSGRWSGTRHVLSIVAATDCKAVVATMVSDHAIAPEAEASAVALLAGESFRRWAANQ